MKQRWVYTVRGRWGEFEGKELLFQVGWSGNVSERVMLQGRAAENERVNPHSSLGEACSRRRVKISEHRASAGL